MKVSSSNEPLAVRQSNMELLRIVAMMFIVVIHVQCRWFVTAQSGWPTLMVYAMLFLQFLVIVGVNVFVLISGWFGIRPTIKGAFKLLFQCVFILVAVQVVGVCTGQFEPTLQGTLNAVTAYKLWFIPSYLGLYFFAPALNLWIERLSRRNFIGHLIVFFIFQIIYGYMVPEINPIGFGESTFSFLGLYMLGRFLNRYKPVFYRGGWLSMWAALWSIQCCIYVRHQHVRGCYGAISILLILLALWH